MSQTVIHDRICNLEGDRIPNLDASTELYVSGSKWYPQNQSNVTFTKYVCMYVCMYGDIAKYLDMVLAT